MTPKEVVTTAIAFAQEITDANDARVEEIERKGSVWLVTLSFRSSDSSAFGEAVTGKRARDYKVFTVNDEDAAVLSMKMRQPQN
jgi:hypothetical protein